MRFHAVFDLDGTLVDSASVCAGILNEMLVERGSDLRVSEAQARRHVSAGGEAMVAALLNGACGSATAAIGEFRARYAIRPTPLSSLFPGVRAGLERLRSQGIGLAIHSNKPGPLCQKVLEDLALAHLFAAVVGSGPGLPVKPDPAGFDLALARAGGARERACYVGDSELDHGVAQRVGIPYVHVTYGYAREEHDFAGAYFAARFGEVPVIIEQTISRGRTRPMDVPRERAA